MQWGAAPSAISHGERLSTPGAVPAYLVIGMWIVVFFNGIASFAQTAQTGGVAYGAHVGGFIAGLILTFILRGAAGGRRGVLLDLISGNRSLRPAVR